VTAVATLSAESRAKLAHLKGDAHFWCEQVFTIRDKKGRDRRLRPRLAQRLVGEDERRQLRERGYARQYILKARQGGFSTYEQARALHQIWSRPGFDALTLAHTGGDTTKLFEITTHAVGKFPPALMPSLGDRETNEVSYPALNTHFYTGTAGSKRTGRGLTLLRAHLSEFAHYEKPRQVLKAIRPAVVPIGSTITLETTGAGVGSEGHTFWQDAVAGRNGYVALFFPWWECDPEGYRLPLLAPDELGRLEPDEADLVRRFGLTLEQVKWRRVVMAEMSRADFLQEYAEDADTCWLAVGGMFYDADVLTALKTRTPTPRATHLGGAHRIYADPPAGERVIIGADTSEGVGGDASTWAARAFPSWRLLAEFSDNRTRPDEFADMLNEWGRRYGNALLVVEKNLHGITVLRRLRDHHRYPVGKIYHRQPLDKEAASDPNVERIGWHTSEESKPILLNAGVQLFKAAQDGHAGVPSGQALTDAFGVVRGADGKYDLNGRDLLVAELLCWIGRSHPVMDAGGALVTF
jgi:hypothetical protein